MTGQPVRLMPSNGVWSTAWCKPLLRTTRFSDGSQMPMSASIPQAIEPLRGCNPNSLAGLVAVIATNACKSIRPFPTPSENR